MHFAKLGGETQEVGLKCGGLKVPTRKRGGLICGRRPPDFGPPLSMFLAPSLTTDIYQYRYVPIECKYSALNNAELENISMKRKVELQCFKSMSKLKYSKSEFGEKI